MDGSEEKLARLNLTVTSEGWPVILEIVDANALESEAEALKCLREGDYVNAQKYALTADVWNSFRGRIKKTKEWLQYQAEQRS